MFESLEEAQTRKDAWVRSYNEQRPHFSLDMKTPVSRFQSNQWQRPVDVSGLAVVARDGSDWVSQVVAAHGLTSVSNQPLSVGKHRAGRRVDVHVQESALQIWDGDDLIKTVLRTSTGEVWKKKRDHRESKVA